MLYLVVAIGEGELIGALSRREGALLGQINQKFRLGRSTDVFSGELEKRARPLGSARRTGVAAVNVCGNVVMLEHARENDRHRVADYRGDKGTCQMSVGRINRKTV